MYFSIQRRTLSHQTSYNFEIIEKDLTKVDINLSLNPILLVEVPWKDVFLWKPEQSSICRYWYGMFRMFSDFHIIKLFSIFFFLTKLINPPHDFFSPFDFLLYSSDVILCRMEAQMELSFTYHKIIKLIISIQKRKWSLLFEEDLEMLKHFFSNSFLCLFLSFSDL